MSTIRGRQTRSKELPETLEMYHIVMVTPGKEVMIVRKRDDNKLYFLCSYTGDVQEEFQHPYNRRSLLKTAAAVESLEEAEPLIARITSSIQKLREDMKR